MKKMSLFCILGMSVLLAACGTKVNRIDASEARDLSGRWNAIDSRQVSDTLIQQSLNEPWYARTVAKIHKEPVVIVGTVINNSMEHIDTGMFIRDMQRALINSGKVQFVASAAERGEVRTERLEQDEFASEATRKAFGKEVGADFMMSGELSSLVDQSGKRAVVTYQVNLKLIDIETNQIVWLGEEVITKDVLRGKLAI